METVGTGVVAVVLTILLRDGGPALVAWVKARTDAGRATAEDRRLDSVEVRQARKEEAAERRIDEAVTIKELKEIIKGQRADIIALREDLHRERNERSLMANKLTACEVQHARAEERIDWLMRVIQQAGLSADPVPGSKTHPTLSPEAPK